MTSRSKSESENSSNDERLEELVLKTIAKGHSWSPPHPWGEDFGPPKVHGTALGPDMRICLVCGRWEKVLTDYRIPFEECGGYSVWKGDLLIYKGLLAQWKKECRKKTTQK